MLSTDKVKTTANWVSSPVCPDLGSWMLGWAKVGIGMQNSHMLAVGKRAVRSLCPYSTEKFGAICHSCISKAQRLSLTLQLVDNEEFIALY